jgi:DNA polymerase-4
MERSVVHLNIIGFKTAVAVAQDKALRGRPVVIAGAAGGRSLALDCSQEAVNEGIVPGMALAVAERRIKDLVILPPDLPAYQAMNTELEKVAARYAPVWENDNAGNLYLDITGTSGLFGPPIDCSSRILRDIAAYTDIKPATAVACNKLVSKVATRAIRPSGLIQIRNGTEAEYMSHQDIRILPGMGTKLLQTAAVVGMREIGEIASLSAAQALALFGKQGPLLRSMAQGIDGTRVEERKTERSITRQLDFNEDVIDDTAIRGAIEALAEHCGLAMRRERLGCTLINLIAVYADGIRTEGKEKIKRMCALDKDIAAVADKIFYKAIVRRIRIRSLGLSLEGLVPLGYEPDLFEPETDIKNRKLQEAVDTIQNKYGAGKVTKGLVLAASAMHRGKRLLTAGATN